MVQHGSTRINTDQHGSTISFNNQFQRTDSQLQLGSAISFNSYQQSITTHQQRSLQHVSNNSNISMRRGVSQASRIDFRGTRSLDVATLEMSVVINQNNTVFFIPLMRQGVCPVASNPTHLLTGRNWFQLKPLKEHSWTNVLAIFRFPWELRLFDSVE